ncbi:S1 domain-containing RNA-binding protein [Atopobacter phocae]|uniref:S1 domain-containing RNA-binding protein n=1 Tax=Atopobacter phocae TaxID=136492 RepID=UPI00046E5861|nr:S1 domain-containing RNA-binding protein [Atopobacter phocae]
MSVEVDQIVAGKVTGITNFGAFIDLGEGQSGLVHISEIANTFVKDINDVLTVGDDVQVKVVKIADDGKISLSIRQAMPEEEQRPPKRPVREREERPRQDKRPAPSKAKSQDFDSLMSAFLKDSDDRLASLKKNTEGKRGGRGGRRS